MLPANRKVVFIILIILLLGGSFLLGRYTASSTTNYAKTQAISDFHEFFITSVLQTEGEIDFETRLQLEGMVRNLNDTEILTAWNNFVNAPSETEAQIELKDLLLVLVRKGRD